MHLASANVRGKSTESSKRKKRERESKRDGEKLPQRLQRTHTHTQSKVGLFKRTFLANTHLFSGLDTPVLLSALRRSEQQSTRFPALSASAEEETFRGH